MLELNRTKCCGLRELHGIQHQHEIEPGVPNPKYDPYNYRSNPWKKMPIVGFLDPPQIVAFVKDQMFHNNRKGAFVTFAAADGHANANTKGADLAEYITEKRLGEVYEGASAINPNSMNSLQVWLWRVDLGRLHKWRRPPVKAKTAKKK
jgi:hypothetical protein